MHSNALPREAQQSKGVTMLLVTAGIKGITPLLMNRFTAANEAAVESGRSAVALGDRGTPRERAQEKAYTLPSGELYIPGVWIFSAMIEAGKFHKNGRSKVTTTRSSLVPAGISIPELEIPLGTKDFEVDSRPVVIPSTQGRIMSHRPRLDEWSVTFTMEIDMEMFSESFCRILLEDAGRKVGIGAFRPQRKGPFGRFTTTRWEIVEAAKAA
jgi:hypothetical protein